MRIFLLFSAENRKTLQLFWRYLLTPPYKYRIMNLIKMQFIQNLNNLFNIIIPNSILCETKKDVRNPEKRKEFKKDT